MKNPSNKLVEASDHLLVYFLSKNLDIIAEIYYFTMVDIFRMISVKRFRSVSPDTRLWLYNDGMENKSYLNFISRQVYNSLVLF